MEIYKKENGMIWRLLESKKLRHVLLIIAALIWLLSIINLIVGLYIVNNEIYIILSITLAFFIFAFQEINRAIIEKVKREEDSDRAYKQKELLEKIEDNVLELRPFKKAFAIISSLEDWLNDSEEKSTFIFYFPYTICPGFWVDGGSGFMGYFQKLEKFNDKHFNNKFIFIGPTAKGETIFQKIIGKLYENDNFKYLNKNPAILDLINAESIKSENLSLCLEKLQDKYDERINRLTTLAKNKRFIKVIEINDIPKGLLSSSFVLKISDTNTHDMFFIDTFNFLSSNIGEFEKNLDIDSVINNDKEFGLLFEEPKARLVNNDMIANLFLSIFLETCCTENDCLYEIRNILFK